VKKYAADGTYHHAFHAVSMCSLSNVFSYYFLLLTTRLMVPITMPSTLSFSLSDCLPVRVSLLLSLSPSLCLSLSLSLSLSQDSGDEGLGEPRVIAFILYLNHVSQGLGFRV